MPTISHVTLRVQNLNRQLEFYALLLGLEIIKQTPQEAILGYKKTALITLKERLDLPFPASHSAGLYHTAFLFAETSGLSAALERIFVKAPALFEGSADHLVSQAFYFHDFEGNGIELYVDRPQSEWRYQDGNIVMDSLPINPLQFLQINTPDPRNNKVCIGHIHLKVGNLEEAKNFYAGLLGFDVVVELPGALFVSKNGYHHHIGLNTWESYGAQKRPETLGLESFTITTTQKINATSTNITDPWGISVILTEEHKKSE